MDIIKSVILLKKKAIVLSWGFCAMYRRNLSLPEFEFTCHMKKWICVQLILSGLSLFILKSALGQAISTDTTILQAAFNNANAVYTKVIGQQLPLNNGPEYNFYNPLKIRSSACFMDTTFTTGRVFYDGAEYSGVQLLYDIYKDQLVAVLFDQYSKYALITERVQNFDLLGHHFININADTLAKNTVITSGYYDEVYHGRSEALSKKYKLIQNYTSTTGELEAYSFFTPTKEDFFIRKDEIYYKVASQGDVLDVLKDKKKQLQQYIKTNKLKFRKDPGAALAGIAGYYDHITN